ncbi:MAG: hypothetical protein RL235_1180, partial [Chlamydiota bacterium]
DGIIEKIFRAVGATSKYYVDFGASDGHVCSNTKYLREFYGWHGLQMDGRHQDASIHLFREYVTAENIVPLLRKYSVPKEFDFLSLDIDYNDFYVWKALLQEFSPRVVCIEYNCVFGPDQDKVIVYDPNSSWDCTDYYGASALAMFRLGKHFGYTLIYQESNAVNLFFVRDDVLQASGVRFKNQNDVEKLCHCPLSRIERNGGMLNHPYGLNGREFTESCEFLR